MSIPRAPDSDGFYGARFAAHLGMPGRQIAEYREEGETALAVTRISCVSPPAARSAPAPAEAAFSILHQLDDIERHACWLGGRPRFAGGFRAGTVSVEDLRDRPQCQFAGRLEALQFYLPRSALDRLAARRGAGPVATLRWRRDVPDPVVAGLSRALIAEAAYPGPDSLLADALSLSLIERFAEAYGGLRAGASAGKGALAPWQERRAREIMRHRLSSSLTIAQVAKECGLTPSHFARAFRRSFGVAPHRYLTWLRVEEARTLLVQPHLSLADIALICGFGDQSHFTRVFGKATGVSPGAWRRAGGGG